MCWLRGLKLTKGARLIYHDATLMGLSFPLTRRKEKVYCKSDKKTTKKFWLESLN